MKLLRPGLLVSSSFMTIINDFSTTGFAHALKLVRRKRSHNLIYIVDQSNIQQLLWYLNRGLTSINQSINQDQDESSPESVEKQNKSVHLKRIKCKKFVRITYIFLRQWKLMWLMSDPPCMYYSSTKLAENNDSVQTKGEPARTSKDT